MIFWMFAGISKVFHLSRSLRHEMPLAVHVPRDLNFPFVTTSSQAVGHLIQQLLNLYTDVLISNTFQVLFFIFVLGMLT